jgi:hypothetical protein
MSLRTFLLVPAMLSLAACATAQAPSAPGICSADAANAYLRKTADAATVEAAREAAGAERVRTLKPGQMVTMEYLAGRLNLYLDASGNIERIACG